MNKVVPSVSLVNLVPFPFSLLSVSYTRNPGPFYFFWSCGRLTGMQPAADKSWPITGLFIDISAAMKLTDLGTDFRRS